jgi:hypothetical protein
MRQLQQKHLKYDYFNVIFHALRNTLKRFSISEQQHYNRSKSIVMLLPQYEEKELNTLKQCINTAIRKMKHAPLRNSLNTITTFF